MVIRYLTCAASIVVLMRIALTPLTAAPEAPTAQPQTSGAVGSTPNSPPDLQGIWTSYHETFTPFERPTGQTPPEGEQQLPDEEAELQRLLRDVTLRLNGPTGAGPEHWLEAKLPSGRASLISEPANGRMPPLTPWAIAQQQANRGRNSSDSYEFLSASTRCLPRGVPQAMFPGYYNSAVQILQSPEAIVMIYEMVHQMRIIKFDGRPHVSPNIRSWMGDSRGRWEGNTLVVDVTNFNGKAGARGPGSEALHVIERFTRIDADTLGYDVTIEDSTVFTAPWKVSFTLKRDDTHELFEYACHEDNQAVTNILSTARAAEKKQQRSRY